jgi:sialic acid synthase SpsE
VRYPSADAGGAETVPLILNGSEISSSHIWVIAEAGVNHNGSVESALQLVQAASDAGADAVKFQLFSADALASADAPTAAYQQSTGAPEDQRALLRKLELQRRDFVRISACCRDVGIAFLATPFDPADVPFLAELGVPAIKIASPDLTHRPLIESALRTGLPVLISTGASRSAELDRAVAWCRRVVADECIVLLHCVSSYPTPDSDANLRRIETLHQRHHLPVGYSDHTTSLQAGSLAAALGACVIEKHLTLNRDQPGPDHAMSLEPDDLAEYIRRIRQAQSLLGDGHEDYRPIEADVRQVARRSIIAARDIPAGRIIGPGMLACQRPAGGIEPHRLNDLLGRRTACHIPRGSQLTWDMLAETQANAGPPETPPPPHSPLDPDPIPSTTASAR